MKKQELSEISGVNLEREELIKYINKIALEYENTKYSSKKTYPVKELKKNFRIISETYDLLNFCTKENIRIHSAGEWILDNFYIIEESVKGIEKDISIREYKKLPGINIDPRNSIARIYFLANELVKFSDSDVNEEIIENVIRAYQDKKNLSMEEIWKFTTFIKCALIEKIAKICTKIYESQIQKIKVENVIYKTIENNSAKKINIKNDYIKNKYAFIEYLSFRLKQYGNIGIEYRRILEEQIKKMGLDIEKIVKREHIYVASLKVSVGNAIKTLKNLNRINVNNIFEKINKTEELLRRDKAGIYEKLTEETKSKYRNKIKEIADKNEVSEIYVAEEILKLADKNVGDTLEIKRKQHIGYFLIDDGIEEIEKVLNKNYKRKLSKKAKSRLYVISSFLVPIFITYAISLFQYLKNETLSQSIIIFIFSLIPIMEIYSKIENYILSKIIKPKIIPKMEYENEIPEEFSTFVVIPCILNNVEKVEEMCKKLEVYYLANRERNIFFALLGDVEEASTRIKKSDFKIIEKGLEEIKKLNEKYNFEEQKKFYFLYRKRKYNKRENKYIGWERKRGLLSNFNKFLLTGESDFRINTIKDEKMPKIKYVITIDSDTNLILNSAKKLIGTASHILNRPIIKEGKVEKGYGIIQPRIGINTESYRKTKFTQIFAMQGGIDFYSNSISDIYNDCFDDAIYTGKGIYDVSVYQDVLKKEIPENVVLSHDLLEGCYLKVLLASDVILMDNFPNKYNSYLVRNNRWTRGDIQISKWLFNSKLSELSKYKIFDNIRRAVTPIVILISTILSLFLKEIRCEIIMTNFFALAISGVIDFVNYILFKESYIEGSIYAHKKYTSEILGIKNTIYNVFLQIAFLPSNGIENLKSIIKSLYRMIFGKKMLEWVTSEESEKFSKTTLMSYFSFMKFSLGIGIIFLFGSLFYKILGVLWIMAPVIAWHISKEKDEKEDITIEERKELLEIGERTWKFFSENITEENNYLIPDNYQENRRNLLVENTSSTNIGLELISIISSYDLGFINLETAKMLIMKILNTINILSKWNGHLYNWYNIKTLEPLNPKFVSTVDSGNFVGYLYIVKVFFEQNFKDEVLIIKNLKELIDNTDFSKLYSEDARLLSIGFSVDENKLIDSYYDFLASEARLASLVAIAKKDIPEKHWNNLSRTLTTLAAYKGLISWSGTAFEYLMPNINVERYKGSILDESLKFAVECQIAYSKKFDLPWGISESAYNIKDLKENYQYKAFGIPWLGVKRGLGEEYVVSPYSTFLSLEDSKKRGIENIRLLKKYNGYGKYGFFESIDFTSSRNSKGKKYEVVKTYMAHHQGLIINSINNYLNQSVIRKRFNENPEIKAVNILLEERMPKNVIITKEKKEKLEKLKNINDIYYFEKNVKDKNNIGIISNDNHFIYINLKDGSGYSLFDNKLIYKYKETTEYFQGIQIYIRNLKNKKLYNIFEKSEVIVNLDKITFVKKDGNFEFKLEIGLDASRNIEIRNLKIKNHGKEEELFEIVFAIEPVISDMLQEYSHPAYNKMFINSDFVENNLLFVRKNKNAEEEMIVGITLYTENEKIGDLEFEIDREKYFGRDNFGIPYLVKNSNEFSNTLKRNVDHIGALKQIVKIDDNSTANLIFLLSIGYEKERVCENLKELKNCEEVKRVFDLSKAKLEEEMRYLRIKEKEIKNYYEFIQIIYRDREEEFKNIEEFSINDLWKFGISGDNPIIFFETNSVEDRFFLREILSLFEYLKIKSINVDLVIINNEKSVYERIVKEEIENAIIEKQIQYLLNSKIFILNKTEVDIKDIEKIRLASKVVINAEIGSLKNYIEYKKGMLKAKEKIYDNIKEEKNEIIENKVIVPKQCKYFNEYGGFLESGKEYFIKMNKDMRLPSVWCNILSNQFFGTLTDENMGGFTWNKNSRLNRITVWNNDNVQNLPSEIIYLKDLQNGRKWSLNNCISPEKGEYYCVYGFGYSRYINLYNDIFSETTIFVPNIDSVKITRIKFKNHSNEKREMKLLYYMKPVLGDDDFFSNKKISITKEKNIIYLNRYDENEIYKDKKAFICFSEKINSYTGNKEFFISDKNICMPEGLDYSILNNEDSIYKDSCVVVQINFEIEGYKEKEIDILLGKELKNNIEKICDKYLNNMNEEYEKVKKEWDNKLSNIKINTPLESMNIILNGWTLYQTLSSRFYGRTGFYQSGGAIGFRDQLQDSLSLKYIDSDYLLNQILVCSRHQFREGDVLHWWHEENKAGIRTLFSDDLLWLVYAVLEYIEYTNDYSILEREEYYLAGKKLEEGVCEKYNNFYQSDCKESIYMHCIRAIEKVEMGEHYIPKIGSGDWNDGFSNIGVKGKGESIWLGFFYYDILNRFIKICSIKKDEEKFEKYTEIKNKLKKVLNNFAWDGNWYKRAINDEGEVIGSGKSNECRIDSIAQSWSVISDAGDNDKKYIAIDSVYKNLVDNENKIIKLFTPPFEKGEINPGYIKAYPPGVRENGGQYTHAAIWYGIANALLGFGDNALEIFAMINPIERTKTREEAKKYKVEPYVLVADIYSNEDMKGRGGWSWYTGSSSWFYKFGIEYILGLQIKNGVLNINPCISSKWKEYSVEFNYKKTVYKIRVKNPEEKMKGVKKVLLNGAEIKEKEIKLIDDGNIYEIDVIM